MLNPPMTKEEAEKVRYDKWSGNPKGFAYDQECCAYEISSGGLPWQCSRKPGHGPDGLYCKQHARKVEG